MGTYFVGEKTASDDKECTSLVLHVGVLHYSVHLALRESRDA